MGQKDSKEIQVQQVQQEMQVEQVHQVHLVLLNVSQKNGISFSEIQFMKYNSLEKLNQSLLELFLLKVQQLDQLEILRLQEIFIHQFVVLLVKQFSSEEWDIGIHLKLMDLM